MTSKMVHLGSKWILTPFCGMSQGNHHPEHCCSGLTWCSTRICGWKVLDPTGVPKLIIGTLPKGGCDNFLLQESITNKMSHLTQACPQLQAKYLQQQEGPPVPGLYPTCFTFNRNMLCLLQTLTNPFWVRDKLVTANPTVVDD